MAVQLDDGSYTNMGLLSRKLTEAGYVLYTLDQLGHGLSEGDRFYIPNGGDWTVHRDILASFALMAFSEQEKEDSSLPIFLMGESYGGNLALHVAKLWQDHPEDAPGYKKDVPNEDNHAFGGIVMFAPAIVADMPPPPITWFLRYILAPIIPRATPFFMPHPLPPERGWKNSKVIEHYTSASAPDKRLGLHDVGKKFCLGTALGLVNAVEDVRENVIPGLNVPFCVCHGTMDEGIPIAGTNYLIKHCHTKEEDRSVNMVEDVLHDLLADDDTKEETVDFVIKWMDGRIDREELKDCMA